MQRFRATLSVGLCAALLTVSVSAETDIGYKVKYSGGSLPNVKAGQGLKMYVDGQNVRLRSGKTGFTYIPTASITEVSYGQEVHRRIGTAAGLCSGFPRHRCTSGLQQIKKALCRSHLG
jgi:hypothetical protein